MACGEFAAPLRSRAEILKAGGNAIDAAVAVGYAEAVANPCRGNIGGGRIHGASSADGRDRFVIFRETAPAGATKDVSRRPRRSDSVR